MNIQEIDKWLDSEYGCSYTRLEELHDWLCDETMKKDKEIKRLNNIINELEKDIEQQITFCTNEADATTNDKYCRIAINYLKHLKDKIKELKGSDEE